MDAFVDPVLRLHALVLVFAAAAGLRLILTGLSPATRRWSLITGGVLIALGLVRELPKFVVRPAAEPVVALTADRSRQIAERGNPSAASPASAGFRYHAAIGPERSDQGTDP